MFFIFSVFDAILKTSPIGAPRREFSIRCVRVKTGFELRNLHQHRVYYVFRCFLGLQKSFRFLFILVIPVKRWMEVVLIVVV